MSAIAVRDAPEQYPHPSDRQRVPRARRRPPHLALRRSLRKRPGGRDGHHVTTPARQTALKDASGHDPVPANGQPRGQLDRGERHVPVNARMPCPKTLTTRIPASSRKQTQPPEHPQALDKQRQAVLETAYAATTRIRRQTAKRRGCRRGPASLHREPPLRTARKMGSASATNAVASAVVYVNNTYTHGPDHPRSGADLAHRARRMSAGGRTRIASSSRPHL
jgi:hypothetical protein